MGGCVRTTEIYTRVTARRLMMEQDDETFISLVLLEGSIVV